MPDGRPPDAVCLEAAADRRLGAATHQLTRIALALGVPAQDAPDVVQDTLLAAHRGLRSFDPARGRLEAWLATILVRRARNARRAERRWRALRAVFQSVGASRRTGTKEIDRVEARLVLDRLVACLSDSQREIVALYEIGELSADEVARTLGHTPAGVRSIARDARNKLAEAARRSSFEEGSRR
jgi:RNA polymerase sigma-70 factor (ECF subfamily)